MKIHHRMSRVVAALSLVMTATFAEADFFEVPGDYPTIQEAIDAAPDGAYIFVAPGVYPENIDFLGKSLQIQGSGPESVLDGLRSGPVVRFVSGEGTDSVLDSFTITGGLASNGGGIEIRGSSPTVIRNVIIDNQASSAGSGIFVSGASAPNVFNNLLVFNTGYLGADAHTVQVVGSSPRIVNNTIMRNDSNAILTSGQGTPEIRNNILARNGQRSEFGARGRGICDFSPNTVTQYNLFFRNTIGALLTAGTDFRSIRRAEAALERARLANNLDGAIRFTAGAVPRKVENATPDRFVPREDTLRPSRAANTGDPDPAYDNRDGSRNTIGFTGGPYSPSF